MPQFTLIGLAGASSIIEELKFFYTKLASMAPLYMALEGVGGQPGQLLDRQGCWPGEQKWREDEQTGAVNFG
jgi:hypothetical protein